jgi:hypothetical protein
MKEYILLKLRSGEEIVASIMSRNRNGMKVFRPMQIRQIPFVDPFTGSLKAATVMENWIGRTDTNEVTIPNNWVGLKMSPSQDVIDVYEKQMVKEDIPSTQPKPQAEAPPPVEHAEDSRPSNPLKEIEDDMNRLLLEMAGTTGSMPGFFPPMVEPMENFQAGKGDKEMVIVNFMFPPKLFKQMMEEGLIEDFLMAGSFMNENGDDSKEDDFDDDEGESRKASSQIRENDVDIREKGDEPYGNSYRDWSSNPSDYL